MARPLRIGARKSLLSQWQANVVRERLQAVVGIQTQLCLISAAADQDLHTPLHAFGYQGVFTKQLDEALLRHDIDLAVHSLKDLSTSLTEGLCIYCVLARDYVHDLLIARNNFDFLLSPFAKAKIATGSVRRQAQWANHYPAHVFVPMRGNIHSRLDKFFQSDCDAMILSAAGIFRMNIPLEHSRTIDFMVPCAGQGVICVVGRSADTALCAKVSALTHIPTQTAVQVERAILHEIGAQCSTPIGVHAQCHPASKQMYLRVRLCSPDGKHSHTLSTQGSPDALIRTATHFLRTQTGEVYAGVPAQS